MPVAQDRNGNSIDPHTVIFPILKEVGKNKNRLVGTGFFITKIGHFVTAKHVILDVIDVVTGKQHAPIHAAHFVEGTKVLVRHITNVSVSNDSDVAVGKMDYHVIDATGDPLMNKVPRFTTEAPDLGTPVCTFAYPESDAVFEKGKPATFRPKYYEGSMVEHSEEPRDPHLVSWPHYRTSITLFGGASGGPAFDSKGRVFGVNCVGGIKGASYMARATELLPLVVPEYPGDSERTVQDLAKTSEIQFVS